MEKRETLENLRDLKIDKLHNIKEKYSIVDLYRNIHIEQLIQTFIDNLMQSLKFSTTL